MISAIISRIVILLFGTLYPAYASYKAVRTKNVREYVKWMMYWIVFALFTCGETFTDVFLSWFPFYYEIKIVLVIWLLSPATKGSSILYRKFVHPALIKREQEIDEYISKAKEQGYHTVLNLGTKGVNYATNVLMQTAIKGGGGLVQQLRKSYSLSDLSGQDESKMNRSDLDEADDVVTDPRIVRRSIAARRYSPRRTASESSTRSGMYFPEVDLDVNRNTRSTDIRDAINLNHIRSSEDISSGYSSADNSATRDLGLMRSTSVSGSTRSRTRQVTTINRVTTIKRPPAAEGSDVVIEEIQESDALQPYFSSNPRILDLPPSSHLSETDPPFIFQFVNNRMKIIEILDYPAEVDIEERLQSSSDSEFLDTNDNDNKLSSDDTNALPTVDSIITTSDLDSLIVPSIVSNDHVIVVDDAHAGAEASIIAPSASASSVDYDSTAADESDVQFTTPGNSPKLQKKKIARKGRYGKQKAPSPPAKTAEQEQTAKITKPKRTKRSSPISKLMQIPGKLAFWHKSSDNLKVPVDSSTSSSSSRRSSIYEDSFEKRNSPPDGSANSEFGSAVDLKLDNIPLSVVEKEEDISKETTEIMEKGLALLGKLTELRESTKELNKLVTDV